MHNVHVTNSFAMEDEALSDTRDIVVRFVKVQKSYDGATLVITDLDLEIQRGEFITLLGPSGSGKTTTLMMLAGFEPITDGEIYLEEQAINRVPPHKRNIGMVFQHYALFPHMSVGENVAFPLDVRRIPRQESEDRIRRALDMVRLPGYGNRKPAQLSGGQQQRVALARALVFQPKIVLLDEPLGALDKNLREQMQYELKHLHQDLGVTMVYVTHDQKEALTMSDRIAVFNDGAIQQLATPDELYERPVNAFVAGFIGENNRLFGHVSVREGTTCLVQLEDGRERVHAQNVREAQVGERTMLSLRPERVVLNPGENEALNRCTGCVRELVYLGDHIRVRLDVAGNDDFVVKVPNASGHYIPRAGESVIVGWSTKDCRALDVDGCVN